MGQGMTALEAESALDELVRIVPISSALLLIINPMAFLILEDEVASSSSILSDHNGAHDSLAVGYQMNHL